MINPVGWDTILMSPASHISVLVSDTYTSKRQQSQWADPFIQEPTMKLIKSSGQFALLVLVSLMTADMSSAQVSSYSVKVGQPHPDFILPSVDDGKPIQLSSMRGKKVLLMHFASW